MIDWSHAPEGAEYWFVDSQTFYKLNTQGLNALYYMGGEWRESGWNNGYVHDNKAQFIRRAQEWPTDEQRIDVIGTNGPSGEHYGTVSAATKRAIELAHDIVRQLSEMSAAELAWIASTDEAKRLVELLGERPALPDGVNQAMMDKSVPIVTANKYDRTIHGKYGTGSCTVDVYRVLNAFGPLSPEIDHAVKKLLAAGTRGAKSERQDLLEAIQSIEARLQYLEAADGDKQ